MVTWHGSRLFGTAWKHVWCLPQSYSQRIPCACVIYVCAFISCWNVSCPQELWCASFNCFCLNDQCIVKQPKNEWDGESFLRNCGHSLFDYFHLICLWSNIGDGEIELTTIWLLILERSILDVCCLVLVVYFMVHGSELCVMDWLHPHLCVLRSRRTLIVA